MRGRGFTALALAATLSSPTLAAAAPPADPFADEGPAPPADVANPDLAEEAPQGAWVRDGGDGDGSGAAQDPRVLNRRIRRAGRITLVGGGIAVLGGITALTGAGLLYVWSPQRRLVKLADENGGLLPTDDPRRHRAISIAYSAPFVIYAGLGVLGAGVITAAVARFRLKRLREQRRASTVSLSPTSLGAGAELRWEVRF